MVESSVEIISIKDDKFNPEYLSQYHLVTCLSTHSIEVGVVDMIDNRILALERYPINGIGSHESYVESLNSVFENHYFLKAGYWKSINVVINNDKMTLLPKELFVDTYAREYLKLNCELNFVYDRIFYNDIDKLDIVNIYSIHNRVFDWLKDIYVGRKINFLHTSHLCILSCFKNDISSKFKITISLHDNYLMIVIMKDNKLNFCNSFRIISNEDVRYFSQAIIQQFSINKNQCSVEVFVSPENEERLNMLNESFGHIKKGNRCDSKTFSFVFDEIAEHNFFNICHVPFD
ncbi:MAG: DUF3822 family protein [Cytophagales bacterium]